MKVTLFDYGAGNLHSLAKACECPGATVSIEPDPARAAQADVLVLPGVGAFAAAAERLAPGLKAMRNALEGGLPCLGVCLGMQLFFKDSEEGPGEGLAILEGTVTKLRARRIPQMGWNHVESDKKQTPVPPLPSIAYYANSYVCRLADPQYITAWTTHEADRFAAAVRYKNVVGVQFHPEKSSTAGVQFIRAFVRQFS